MFSNDWEHLFDFTTLLWCPGVHSVDVKYEKNEVTIKGAIEAKKVHQRIQKWSKKKVELISETKSKEVEKGKETKKVISLIDAFIHTKNIYSFLKILKLLN